MEKYQTATVAAEYIWNTFAYPNRAKKDMVLEMLEDYINRKLNEDGSICLCFLEPGNISLVVKYCSQEAGVFNAIPFDLKITKDSIKDYLKDGDSLVFKVSTEKRR